MKPSLKTLIHNRLKEIYPNEMSSLDIERFARDNGFLGETGRKRCGDLIDKGLVKTQVRIIQKQDGKCVEVAFHKAIMDEPIPEIRLEDMPEWELWHGLQNKIQTKLL